MCLDGDAFDVLASQTIQQRILVRPDTVE